MFNPKNSGTFQNIPCSSPQCNSVGKTTCDASNHCKYDAHYVDASSSNGDVAIDTLTLGSTNGRQVAFPKSVFGCGFSNKGIFNEKTSGIVGLGRGSVSLVSQIGSSIDGKFSYCLIPISSLKDSSKLSFGQNAVVSGPGTVSTALVDGHRPAWYFLTLEGISVGDKRFNVSPGLLPVAVADGNIIIDSGTTLTLLPQLLYSNMEFEVASQMTLERVRILQNVLNLCYKLPSDKSFSAPTITIHFKNANLKLDTYNTFFIVSEGVVCFAFQAYSSGSIFGNIE
ncbi:hypothetical protein K1719_036705 [Acacia pycnantha]|nr:hypothetical protein K1719_036705 [Acacia pycnantha]